MNKYALQIRARWQSTAPTRLQELQNQEEYFTGLGELVAGQVNEMVTSLAGTPPENENYLERVGRLSRALRQAEELAMSELDWPPVEETDPRAEWESTTTSEDALAEWAWELQGQSPFDDELQTQSAAWMLSTTFLEELAAASNPWTFLQERSETMTASRTARFQRDQAR